MVFERSAQDVDPGADVIVVGAGAVGLVTGVALARQGYRVRLLEAGPATLQERSQQFFLQARAIGHPLPGLHVGRFRMLGGTTNFWGGQLVRFDPVVFEPRDWMHDHAAWPVSRATLEPFYDEVLTLLGITQNPSDEEVMERLGISLPADDDLSFFFTRWAPETNFARQFADDIEKLPNLLVHLDMPATGLVLDEDGVTVRGVRCRDATGRDRQFEGRHVILCNGTIEIARLLAAPLADGRSAPWADHVWLGRGFIDHLDCYAGDVKLLDKDRFHALFDNVYLDKLKYQPKIKLTERSQISHEMVGVAANFVFNSSYTEHLANMKIFARSLLRGRWETKDINPLEMLRVLKILMPMVFRYVRYQRMYNPADLGIKLRLNGEQRMLAESRVMLRDERDATGLPVADVDWRIDGRELESMAFFAERIRDYLQANGLATVALVPELVARDPAFVGEMTDLNHQMGTTRIGTTAATGVVDGDLRVHGTRNLFVAGAAVFPSSGFANPTFTALALGLRLAACLAQANEARAA